MSTDTALQPVKQHANVPAVAQPRLPYHPGLKERFGVDQTEWRALVESTFPNARSVGSVILALAYCKARNLDPFKKTVHIVPIWDKERGCEVETVWPGIAEYRTTAARTGCYAGHDEVAHGPMIEKTWEDIDRNGNSNGEVTIAFPEWSQMTVYRMVGGTRCPFPGPRVYWLETYACKKNGVPNTMWTDRPIGMIDKCAEAAALRGAFPEELGSEPSYEEWGGFRWHGRIGVEAPLTAAIKHEPPIESKSIGTDDTPETVAEKQALPIEQPTPPAPETAPPASPPADDQAIAVAQWIEEIKGLESLTELAEAKRSIPATFNAADQQRVLSAIEMREAEIRGKRCSRSNKQQSMLPPGVSATEAGL